MTCRYDKAAERHLLRTHLPACDSRDCQGCEPCLRDANGNPVRHCTARIGCNGHLGEYEQTCPGCIEEVRTTLRVIVDLAADALLEEAIEAGVDSEAVYLAGPACDPEAWSWRKVTARQGGPWHMSQGDSASKLDPDEDDEHHPYSVLTRWEFMLREDYGQQRTDATSIVSAAKYLTDMLPRLANDDGQDWRLFAHELNACRNHLESVIHDSRAPEMGAPCPACTTANTKGKPLVKHYRNIDERTGKVDPSGALDWWGCRDDDAHWWNDEDYRLRVAAGYLAHSPRLTAPQIAEAYGIPAGSVRSWASTGRVHKRGKDDEGRQMYDVNEARRCAGHDLAEVIAT